MHHVVLDRWSRRTSPLHRRDARAKILAALALLISIATTDAGVLPMLAAYGAIVAAGFLAARLPLFQAAARAGVVLPFSLAMALVSWVSGDPARAASVVVKSYLSASTVLLLIATTPLTELLSGAEKLGAPRVVTLVVQFLYRYLFVISEQAQHMLQAARCRSGSRNRGTRRRFQAAAGALAVLFSKSYIRAEGIHNAMLARGFRGRLPAIRAQRFQLADFGFLLAALVVAAGTGLALRGIA